MKHLLQDNSWEWSRFAAAGGALVCFSYFNASGPIAPATGMFVDGVAPGSSPLRLC